MKSHLTSESAQKMVGQVMEDTVKRVSQISFMDGAHAISKLILTNYLPPIESAKNAKERKEAIDNLRTFLGKSENLFQKQPENEQKEATPDENSQSV